MFNMYINFPINYYEGPHYITLSASNKLTNTQGDKPCVPSFIYSLNMVLMSQCVHTHKTCNTCNSTQKMNTQQVIITVTYVAGIGVHIICSDWFKMLFSILIAAKFKRTKQCLLHVTNLMPNSTL